MIAWCVRVRARVCVVCDVDDVDCRNGDRKHSSQILFMILLYLLKITHTGRHRCHKEIIECPQVIRDVLSMSTVTEGPKECLKHLYCTIIRRHRNTVLEMN